jgi:toluene monooxygenase system ferredoxin subunit
MFSRVCKLETVAEGGMRLVIADAQLIVLAWPERGQLRAVQGVCPHTSTPLADAEFDGRVLRCPLHFWSWDLATNQPIQPTEVRLAEYPVKVDEGIVYIDTEGVAPIFAGR